MLSSTDEPETGEDGLVAALRPIESLSNVARSIDCRIEVNLIGQQRPPFFVIEEDSFQRISGRLLLSGATTVVGTVERTGGATSMRCLLRVPGRRHLLYCTVESKDLVRRLGQHLYEQIAATGAATWIHRTWRIYQFTIRDFTQPQLGDPSEALGQLHNAGLKAWDRISDPGGFIRELRRECRYRLHDSDIRWVGSFESRPAHCGSCGLAGSLHAADTPVGASEGSIILPAVAISELLVPVSKAQRGTLAAAISQKFVCSAV